MCKLDWILMVVISFGLTFLTHAGISQSYADLVPVVVGGGGGGVNNRCCSNSVRHGSFCLRIIKGSGSNGINKL